MANKLFKKKIDENLTKDKAVELIRNAEDFLDPEYFREIIKHTNKKDIEEVVRKALTIRESATMGIEFEELCVIGDSLRRSVTDKQRSLAADPFDVFRIVIWMTETKRYIPQTLIDDLLVREIINAYKTFGRDDCPYSLEMITDAKGKDKPVVRKNRMTYSIRAIADMKKYVLDNEMKARFDEQEKGVGEFFAKYGQDCIKNSKADIYHGKYDDPDEDEEEKEDKKTKKDNKKKEFTDEELKNWAKWAKEKLLMIKEKKDNGTVTDDDIDLEKTIIKRAEEIKKEKA